MEASSAASPVDLAIEPRDDLLGVHAQLDDFQRHAPPHRFGLLGDIDHATTAFANPLQQLVVPERLTDGFVGSLGEIELDGGPGYFGSRGQHRVRLIMRHRKRVKAGAQGGVAFTNGVQKRHAFLDGLSTTRATGFLPGFDSWHSSRACFSQLLFFAGSGSRMRFTLKTASASARIISPT